jgi:hypothetical protein
LNKTDERPLTGMVAEADYPRKWKAEQTRNYGRCQRYPQCAKCDLQNLGVKGYDELSRFGKSACQFFHFPVPL